MKLDLTGNVYGRLTVLCEGERRRSPSGTIRRYWVCKCDCGNECVVHSGDLRNGQTTSCGCLQRERAAETHKTHGMRKHPLYSIWCSMMRRTGVYKCSDDRMRRNYIDRGISVCDEWQKFENFAEWAVEHGYAKGLDLDRRDNDRGYSPDNCRFVTHKQNTNNRRCTQRLSDGTPLAEFVSSFGIETTRRAHRSTKEYQRVCYAFKNHGEQSATMLAFDIALEQIANKTGFEYCKNAIVHI